MDTVAGALTTAVRDLVRPRGRLVELPDHDRLDGKTALVTGANRGLGRGIAIGLARRGARVILACRSGIPEAGETVARLAATEAVEMIRVDLADLGSVSILADALAARGRPLDLVVTNAGVVTRESRPTQQGYEQMFGINYLAHALLLRRLLSDGVIPNLALGGGGCAEGTPRIVIVSSEVHRSAAPIDFDRLGELQPFGLAGAMKGYAHSKLLNVMMAMDLARRLAGPSGAKEGVEVAVHSLCPGPVSSDLGRDAPWYLKPLSEPLIKLFFTAPVKAALPVVYLAAARELEGETGRYLHRRVDKVASDAATDPRNGQRLWEATERLLAPYLNPPLVS